MYSSSIISLVSASALFALAKAAPFPGDLPPGTCPANSGTSFYSCYKNGFKGCCSVDACNLTWCPDYEPYTYNKVAIEPVKTPSNDPITPTEPITTTPVVQPATSKLFYLCASNGFRGDCSVDPCALPWCPDYEPGLYSPRVSKRSDVGIPPAGKFEIHCQLPYGKFDGFCSTDPCGRLPWCPDYVLGTYTPIGSSEPVVDTAKPENPAVETPKKTTETEVSTPKSDTRLVGPGQCQAGLVFVICNLPKGAFNGCCSSDPCGRMAWCPDYYDGTYVLRK